MGGHHKPVINQCGCLFHMGAPQLACGSTCCAAECNRAALVKNFKYCFPVQSTGGVGISALVVRVRFEFGGPVSPVEVSVGLVGIDVLVIGGKVTTVSNRRTFKFLLVLPLG